MADKNKTRGKCRFVQRSALCARVNLVLCEHQWPKGYVCVFLCFLLDFLPFRFGRETQTECKEGRWPGERRGARGEKETPETDREEARDRERRGADERNEEVDPVRLGPNKAIVLFCFVVDLGLKTHKETMHASVGGCRMDVHEPAERGKQYLSSIPTNGQREGSEWGKGGSEIKRRN